MKSYAQNFEDVILWRALRDVENGFYIDVGACDPVVDSVSLAFYEAGWRGVHVEPTPKYAQKLRDGRQDEEVIEAAVGSSDGSISIYEISDTGLSTGCASIAEVHAANGFCTNEIHVPCLHLSQLLDRYSGRDVHWLKIDVEGMEQDVVESWMPSIVRPWIVVVESTRPGSPEPSFAAWEGTLCSLGYDFIYFDGVNRFYISTEHPELKRPFGPGPNYFDGFALGTSSYYARDIIRDLVSRHTEVGRLSVTLADREAEVVRLSERLKHWEAEVGRLSAKLTHREAEVGRLGLQLTQKGAEAKAAELRYSSVLSSTSWRVSAPIRWAGAGGRQLLRPFFERGLIMVRRYPALKRVAWATVALSPTLVRRVKQFAGVRTKLSQAPETIALHLAGSEDSGSALIPRPPAQALDLRARQIFSDLANR